MENTELKQDSFLQRLCSEIQLFDLCDLLSCRFKVGRFCSNHEFLEKFERIADEELRSPEQYVDDELEDGEEINADGFYAYDDCEAEVNRDWDDDE